MTKEQYWTVPCPTLHWRSAFGPSCMEFVHPGCWHFDNGATRKIDGVFSLNRVEYPMSFLWTSTTSKSASEKQLTCRNTTDPNPTLRIFRQLLMSGCLWTPRDLPMRFTGRYLITLKFKDLRVISRVYVMHVKKITAIISK